MAVTDALIFYLSMHMIPLKSVENVAENMWLAIQDTQLQIYFWQGHSTAVVWMPKENSEHPVFCNKGFMIYSHFKILWVWPFVSLKTGNSEMSVCKQHTSTTQKIWILWYCEVNI